MQRQRDAVQIAVLPGQCQVVRLHVEPVQLQPVDPRAQAQQRRPSTTAEIQHPLARPRRHRGGQKHRIGRGPVTLLRLDQPQPPTQKRVLGQVIAGKRGFNTGCTHSQSSPS